MAVLVPTTLRQRRTKSCRCQMAHLGAKRAEDKCKMPAPSVIQETTTWANIA
eukprot:CAMPEP_0177266456 /NCGR_PEP_ID=MMETSP0367-20130122/62690_1 /TAXON_ID=447022 ORGANISM="Scrippsiella hangoei-like, Strain SHHI-4" /NCGR_SAMPLE_ID=MMETSP0367 /ASSEMBLY_ACC=CAM_ASM_000362 /LENGTH=51 /DNA_ID=CAMNT_0018721819 /DNA_START=33 /DNA_END=188 /DNA_ORIENTATION=+